MRREDRENNSREFFDYVFAKADVLFLAMQNGEFPYCLPFNFVADQNRIYIHSALHGLKIDLLRQNPHVAFSLCIDVKIDTEHATTFYKSLAGAGLAYALDDVAEKCRALDLLAIKYNALCKRPAPLAMAARVSIIRIDIIELTGKCNLPD